MTKKTTLSTAIGIALGTVATFGVANLAKAGPGFADATAQDGTSFRIQTYFANSPSGDRDALVPEGTTLTDANGVPYQTTGKALRKFVDPLPLPDALAGSATMADGVTQRTIPVGVPEKWINPQGVGTQDDYYEIAVVEYKMRFHSDLKNETTMRGYVQIDRNATYGLPGTTTGSIQYPLIYPDSGLPIQVQKTDGNGKLIFEADGVTRVMVPAYAVKKPEFLGPAILAQQGTPVRFKFLNLLPAGRAEIASPAVVDPVTGKTTTPAVISKRHGDLFLPVDPSIVGAGFGPDGATLYTQNRATIHLHGGDTPWISDGTQNQWITPVEEANPANPLSLAHDAITPIDPADPTLGTKLDPNYLPAFLRGASAANVPDMNDPGPGGMTFYFPNAQSARLMFYHDHTAGETRLNVYAGEAAAYILQDAQEAALEQHGLPPLSRMIPLVLQDRTFVPEDIALQDGKWNTTAWGDVSDSWFPHVYETVQDPAQINNWNAVGRWHYGPWFWPVFNAAYGLPSGEYGDATTTPEAWMDTAVVNGVAYPTVTVDPTTYRLRILNASNDRMMSFNLFVADPTVVTVDGRSDTEVAMAPPTLAPEFGYCNAGVTRPQPILDAQDTLIGYCTPDTWADAFKGAPPEGLPDPQYVGPSLHQIGSEGGLMPQVATYDPAPMSFIQDKGRVNVLNVNTRALFLAPAERADVVVDFSQYAGKTLIVYNDSGAPVPAGDPRNDYFTGVGDQSGAGGAEDTKPGYGPNTRTMMQIKVNPTFNGVAPTPADAFETKATGGLADLKAALPGAYQLSQKAPVVGQSAYNGAFNTDPAATAWTDQVGQAYGSIYVGSLKEPQFTFTPGTPNVGGFNSVTVTAGGTGYIQAPTVSFSDPSNLAATGALAKATLKIDTLTLTNKGANYTTAPTVTINANAGGGSGATATASLGVNSVSVTGSCTVKPTAVNFSAPPAAPAGGTPGTKATGIVTGLAAGKPVVQVTNPGVGYAGRPTVTFSGGTCAVAPKGTVNAGVYGLELTAPDPKNPDTKGGGGYTDLTQVAINFAGGGGTGAAASASGRVFDVTMVNNGTGYTPTTEVAFAGGGGTGATAFVDTNVNNTFTGGNVQGKSLVKTKAIQELFEPTYGRLNATLGVEIPFTSALTQTTIPLGSIDEVTESFADGETQIWKITHNGVDSHPVHFHLLNVQLINRVGWDGYVMPPEPNELGWKETIKMNPLEDIIVAVRAKRMPLPGFGLPHSVRALDPTQPLDSPFGFTQVDPNTGNLKTVINRMFDYNWEYVWHCHILGHEENDFLRPVSFNANDVVSQAPIFDPLTDPLTGVSGVAGNVTVNWADPSVAFTEAYDAEIGFRVERKLGNEAWGPLGDPAKQELWEVTTGLDEATATVLKKQVNTLANATTFTDTTAEAPAAPVVAPVVTPTKGLTSVTLNWGAVANASGYNVYRDGVLVNAAPLTVFTYTDSSPGYGIPHTYEVKAVGSANTYSYRVVAVNAQGETASNEVALNIGGGIEGPAGTASVTLFPPAPAVPGTVRDGFNRNNAANLGNNWSQIKGGNSALRVTSNAAQAYAPGSAWWNATGGLFGVTQGAGFTYVNNTVNNTALFLKASVNNAATNLPTLASAVRVLYNAGNVTVAYTTDGTNYTNAVNGTISTGSNLGNGNKLKAAVDSYGFVWVWKVVGTTTTLLTTTPAQLPNDPLWTTGGGRAGMQLPTNARVDDFLGGNL